MCSRCMLYVYSHRMYAPVPELAVQCVKGLLQSLVDSFIRAVASLLLIGLRRLEPTSKALAAERRSLIAQHAAAEKLPELPRVSIPVQRGMPASVTHPQPVAGQAEAVHLTSAMEGTSTQAEPALLKQQPTSSRGIVSSQATLPQSVGRAAAMEGAPAPYTAGKRVIHAGLSEAASSSPETMQDGGHTAGASAARAHTVGLPENALTEVGSSRAMRDTGKQQQQRQERQPERQEQREESPNTHTREATAAALAAVGVKLGPPTALELRAAGAPAADDRAVTAPNGSSVQQGMRADGHGPHAATASALAATQRALAARGAALKPPTSGTLLICR